MMGIGEGWAFALDAGVFSMMNSRSRHSDSSVALDLKRDWELLAIGITDLSEIQAIIDEARSFMFSDDIIAEERELSYSIKIYPTFTVLDIPLSSRTWWTTSEDHKTGDDVKKHKSSTLDQIVFCSLLIALLKEHLIDLGEHILKKSGGA